MIRLILLFSLVFLLFFCPITAQNSDTITAISSDTLAIMQQDTKAETIVGNFAGWFEEHINYFTITILMALESSFIPIPSEMVLGPAAYLAADPESDLNIFLVIIFATTGSLIGALIIYGLSAWVGRKALYKFADSRLGTFLTLDSDKIKYAEEVFNKRSKTSVCIGRLIAGLRLFISIPAGLAKMNLFNFAVFTFIGSTVYNIALALIGYYLHGQADLIEKYFYEVSIATIVITILFVVFFIIRYFFIRYRKRRFFGLIGHPLGHSYSKVFFTKKFKKEKLNAQYDLYELKSLDKLDKILNNKRLYGLNVTIPYKEQIITHIDKLDETAQTIGAVNVIKIDREGKVFKTKGYNTDTVGFKNSIKPYIRDYHSKALILGTGGAAKAINYALQEMNIETLFVSRTPEKENEISYNALTEELINEYFIIINATPIGTYPLVNQYPDIPYEYITNKHILFDAVYNPAETQFLKRGKLQGAQTLNGEQMLYNQAEEAWRIWNDEV